jgi:hypothetical protein
VNQPEARQAGRRRSLVLALGAIPLVGLSFSWIASASTGPDGSHFTTLSTVAETAGLLVAIAAILLGDEVTNRGRLGRRLGMVLVVFAIGANLAGKALIG